MSEQLYTSSRLRVWRQCPRAHRYRYDFGIQTPPSGPQTFGSTGHYALEAWYRARQGGETRIEAAFASLAEADVSDLDRVRLRVIVAAYDARWGGDDWEVLAVESQFRYFLGDIEIGGKLDALIRDRRDGKAYVVEHKFSSQDTSPGSPYWQKLAVDTQVSIYSDGAAFGLDTEIAGVVYDVLKRPQHELKLATPESEREYTIGKGCKKCGGSAKAGEVEKGRGFYTVAFASEVKEVPCDGCAGTGWKLGSNGKPDAPRLVARQRVADETLEEYEARLTAEIAERPDDYLARSVIVRLDSELPRMRQELIDTIRSMQALDAAGLAPPNHDACVFGREMCAFFIACSGQVSIDDTSQFPRGVAHPELAEPAAEAA